MVRKPRKPKAEKDAEAVETHDDLFKDGCPVCLHDARLAAEKYYLSGSFRPVELDRFLGTPDGSFLKHARASKLNIRLAQNQDAFYGAVMDRAMDIIDNGELDPSDLLKAGIQVAKQQDAIQGRIKGSEGNAAPPQILIANFPVPGGYLPAAPATLSGMPLERPTIDAEAVWVPAGGKNQGEGPDGS